MPLRHSSELFAIDLRCTASNSGPESAVLTKGLPKRFSGIEAHEAKEIALCQADIHCRKVQAADIFDTPAEGHTRPLLSPMQIDQK